MVYLQISSEITHSVHGLCLAWLGLQREAGSEKSFPPLIPSTLARKVIAEAINQDSSIQVLEPSVQGCLRILSIQFPRNDLYLLSYYKMRLMMVL